jgi:tetratricopeptide (TPR) repeat protein
MARGSTVAAVLAALLLSATNTSSSPPSPPSRSLPPRDDPLAALFLYKTAWQVADTALASADSGSGAPDARLPVPLPRLVSTLEEVADKLTLIKRYAEAAETRERALRLRLSRAGRGTGGAGSSGGGGGVPTTVADLVTSYAGLAQDRQHAGDYAGALDALAKARAAAKGAGGLDPASKAVLLRFESSIRACDGDARRALDALDRARVLTTGGGGKTKAKAKAVTPSDAVFDPAELLAELDVVRQAAAEARASAVAPSPPPTHTPASLDARADALVARLLAHGPWENPAQLPKTYIRGLASRPWHSVPDHFPHLAPVVSALQAAAPALRAEYAELRRRSLLFPETECIHDAKGGSWKWYSSNGFWVERDPASGCAVDTPAACALSAEVAALAVPGLQVMRTGYSAVGRRAHLRPHCGMTNGQLKFHLGLTVPAGPDGAPCARIRVGNETRAWEEGKVLFFDDSFEHEVWSECESERVVFQFVFVHPDVAAGAGAGVGGGGGKGLDTVGH